MTLHKSLGQVSDTPGKTWNNLGRLLMYDLDALRLPLLRDFVHMLEYLRTVETSKGKHILDMWLQLGSATGVAEELRKEHDRKRTTVQAGLVGCSWIRCPMYDQDDVEDIFMCGGCHMAMYCGLSCQDR